MERKYQVFISSTFTDLKKERQSITNCLLMANCIPTGMEAFVATDDEQFNIIKKVIDVKLSALGKKVMQKLNAPSEE